jgi:phage tail-like protein
MPDLIADPALSICFVVTVDDIPVGSFTSCDGLGAEVVVETREEGGNSLFVHQLPARLKYPNIKLSRPVMPGAKSLAAWFTRLAASGFKPSTGNIEARDSEQRKVASWGLLGVVPVRWTGPQFNVDQAKAAIETLELAHHGFTDMGKT